MNNLAIIPARGGSKRIHKKNIKDFLGKPIISYSVEAALESGLFNEVMVSTDDDEIARIATELGARVPFLRSGKNSDDHATLTDVLLEVIKYYEGINHNYENICCLLPTAPLITASRIKEGFDKLIDLKLESVCPVVAFSYPIFRALEITDKNELKMIWPEYLNTRSQEIKPAFHDCGSFYWVLKKSLVEQQTLFCKNGGAIILPEMEVQDIDNDTDWKLAELKHKLLYG